ncbi:uncharacterized protein LOC120264489 [Dioscorea cayenensis subsp. rotundata]|uniref:Uncharacterized protein LOC120264489 n=1 Tax=Dioscorea cayennensis subsp. rotundata TaxID=55577 RepID=A0AB40BLD4_DIOCR|nr:uncharacterized protein LOC120264489 [Dioscorea cayenensis subsp. rotundata]
MASTKASHLSLAVALFGCLSFIFGVIAENKKPPFGTPVPGKDVVICKFPTDPTVALGIVSIAALFISTLLGWLSVFFPYGGKSVPKDIMFRNTTLLVFFTVAVGVFVLGEGMMIWATITEALHRIHNVHQDLNYACPTAKTGLFGGAAFLALDTALFWLVCQMLTQNVRTDYFEEDDPKGEYGQVLATDYVPTATGHTA